MNKEYSLAQSFAVYFNSSVTLVEYSRGRRDSAQIATSAISTAVHKCNTYL